MRLIKHTPIHQIAFEISCSWTKVSPYAKPYLDAMRDLDQIDDMYGLDTGESVIRYFLANAQGWRGADARAYKQKLKEILTMVDKAKQTKNHLAAYGRKE